MYVVMSHEEKNSFLKKSSKEPYRVKGHTFVPLTRVGKNYCKSCGLVRLRNPITDWCIAKGCNYSDHSGYKGALKRLTKQEGL